MDKEEYPVNEKQLPHKDVHDPYHTLFANMRPSEVIILMIFSWSTVCPYEEQHETNTKESRGGFKKRMRAWDAIFGSSARQCDAIRVIIEYFVDTEEDIKKTEEAIEIGGLSGYIKEAKFKKMLASKKQAA